MLKSYSECPLLFEDTGSGWYAGNTNYALDFFSGPAIPAYAIEQLRYPIWGLSSNGYAPGFNLPVEDGVQLVVVSLCFTLFVYSCQEIIVEYPYILNKLFVLMLITQM
jgi:hypothetical protein